MRTIGNYLIRALNTSLRACWMSRFNYEKSRIIFFLFDIFTSHLNLFNNIRITLYCSVCMRTSGEKVGISKEAERVQSVAYSHIISLSRLYI